MNITCNLIKDILPLYVEDIASKDSRDIVDEHILHCPKCRKQLVDMQKTLLPPRDTDISPLLKIESTIRKKRRSMMMISIMVTIIFCITAIVFLTTPEYKEYDAKNISLSTTDEGYVVISFNDEITGYDINVYPSKYENGNVYHLTTWSSFWNTNIINKSVQSIVLNPDCKAVNAIYYYNTNGKPDILIYGQNQNEGSVVITLPRLFLGGYLFIAIVFLVICIVIQGIFFRNKKISEKLIKITVLPISYILGHLVVKGLKSSTYSGIHDFFGILLVMIPLYVIILYIIQLIRTSKFNKLQR